ncbi:MAG: methionine gamma-lyase family protein [Oscillospiraceae bacterium]|jgi:cystathionine beta-lyase family protein involved in aluminum resistance|nr:methionine gamma-lyase family protein [Oscillospiraceae bacterium]
MIYPHFQIDPRLLTMADQAQDTCAPLFLKIDAITEYNQQKVLAAFHKNGVSESHFAASTGYGYGDRGREVLEGVVADCFGAQNALIRHSFASGTHTLSVALFGILRPGDTMLSLTGRPYDTICPVIGIAGKQGQGSLRDFGISYEQIDLTQDGRLDFTAIAEQLQKKEYKLVYLQRSRGYTLRASLSVEEIRQACALVRNYSKNAVIMVDNCYGEFVEQLEPTEVGADIIAGSLIKNPGGGIAKSGGYIAGKAECIELCSYRMTTPGVGREVGATLGNSRELFLGIFNAPHVTGEALKTAVFAASLFTQMGFSASPAFDETRHDIIQSILLHTPENLIAFCRGIQRGSPVDSFVNPEPWPMPGYDCDVIMAAGAFTLGSSIELSADAPLREPYAVWLQGGLNFHSGKIGILLAAQNILNAAKTAD